MKNKAHNMSPYILLEIKIMQKFNIAVKSVTQKSHCNRIKVIKTNISKIVREITQNSQEPLVLNKHLKCRIRGTSQAKTSFMLILRKIQSVLTLSTQA